MQGEKCWCGSGLAYSECHADIEKKLRTLKLKGKKVPSKKLIKNKFQIDGIRKAGYINSLVLDKVAENISAGMSTEDINTLVDAYTRELGGIPAPLNYEGFPKSVCTSLNDVICHGIPNENEILKSGDIINVDCTTIVDGYFGDASRMFLIGDVSENAKKLTETTFNAMKLAVSNLKPYCHLGDIGYYINGVARQNGYTVVREIGGHGVGLQMHEDPYVCHIGSLGKGMVLCPGMVFTVEPMINEGIGGFYVDDEDGWQVYTADGLLSAQWENTVLITENGYEILSE